MLVGTAIALALIALCLVVTLRSVNFGLISLIPNATPALIAFGIWGYLVGEVGMSASIVAAATLGLIVDNTIHFISKYQHARRDLNGSPDDAIHYAFATVGTAALTTTAILMAGFASLSLSTFQVNETLGLLTVIVLLVALLTDFFLLPPLLGLIDRERIREPGIDLARVEALRRQHAHR
jgi:predicted RND superfamily exporter protein